MELPKVCLSRHVMQKVPGGGAAVSNALRTTHSTCLAILVIHSVANLVIVSAGEARRFLVGFRHEVWFLPLRPAPVLRLHRICREMKIENPVFVSRKFENEQPS